MNTRDCYPFQLNALKKMTIVKYFLILLLLIKLSHQATAQAPRIELAISKDMFIVGAYDFDMDGDLDLLNATQMFGSLSIVNHQITWIENDGSNSFNKFHGSKNPTNMNGVLLTSIEVHDIDLDGDPDVLAIQSGSNAFLHVYENKDGELYGNQMSIPCSGFLFADLENEGNPSLYITSGLSLHRVWFEDGLFTTQLKFTSTSSIADGLTIPLCGDFNNDGNNDFAFIQDDYLPSNPGQDDVAIVLNTSEQIWNSTIIANGQGTSNWSQIKSIAMADADDDGDLDLYMTFNSNGVRLTLNDGLANFTTTCPVPSGVNSSIRKIYEVGQEIEGPPDMMAINDLNLNSPIAVFYKNITCNLLENVSSMRAAKRNATNCETKCYQKGSNRIPTKKASVEAFFGVLNDR